MKRIIQILENDLYKKMHPRKMIRIAKQEFKKFNDDDLKVRFLEEAFKKYPKDSLGNMSSHDVAILLVDLGTFEGCQ